MTSPAPDPLSSRRTEYDAGTLGDDAPTDPFALFEAWMRDALDRHDQVGDLPDATAVVLSTVRIDEAGRARPRSRTVLLKGSGPEGFVLYTHRGSDKGEELARTPWASLLLPWYALQRQVRIEGAVDLLDDETSDAYFASRPRPSQIGAWTSQQSAPITDRAAMDAAYAEVEQRFAGREVPRPPFWGGYRVVPDRLEFWQGRSHRVHDRLVFERVADAPSQWVRHRLQP